MQDFPEFDNYLQDQSTHAHKRVPRPGVERIPEFDRTATVTLEIEVLKETYDKLLNAIVANEWEREEGMRTVLLTGLGYLDTESNVTEQNRHVTSEGEVELDKQANPIARELAAYHSMYSVMKFKAYKLYKANQTLEFNIAGLRETERMWEGWANRMRHEHTSLQAECIRLRSLMSEFKLDWDHAPVNIAEITAQMDIDQSAITTPLLPHIIPDYSPEEPQAELPLPPPPPLTAQKPSLWGRFKNFLRGE